MALSKDIASMFAKEILKTDEPAQEQPVTLNGTVVEDNGVNYVRLDGSDIVTPVTTTTAIKNGERVTVMIKEHSAIVTGNLTDPSAGGSSVDEMGNKIDRFETIVADVVHTDDLEAIYATIDNLTATDVTITGKLDAAVADIGKLEADNVTISGKLDAVQADITDLDTDKLDAEVADLKYATIGDLEVTNADIHNLEADYADFKVVNAGNLNAINANIDDLKANSITTDYIESHYADIDFANVGSLAVENFFSKSGMIEDLVVGDQTVTGRLVGVTIVGDLIEGGTIKADKLVVQGTDGLYYKLNVEGETVSAAQTEYNSLNGSIITAQSITAEKISVNDLVAFGATIGGFHITDSEIYSGVKESAQNDTRGVYMNNDGEFSIGDGNHYLRFFRDTDGTYKLALSASAISFGSSKQNLDEVIADVNDKIDNMDIDVNIGVRNLALKSDETRTTSDQNGYIEYDISEFGQDLFKVGDRFTIAFDAMSTLGGIGVDCGLYGTGAIHSLDGCRVFPTTEWARYEIDGITLTGKDATRVRFTVMENATSAFTLSIKNVKVERGIAATDWTLAPEDMPDWTDIEEVDNKVTNAESQIQSLGDSISTLVTDSDGTSLMEQTSSGWKFNIGGIQSALQGQIDQVASEAGELGTQLESIINVTSYITMGQDDSGSPYIELGTNDGTFKIRITNESIDFLEGANRVAYLTNQQLYINTATIQTDLRIGDAPSFIWRRRENGNLGLRWEA